jgi:hypothetical protein
MITELILGWLTGVVVWLIGLLPEWALPRIFADLLGWVNLVTDNMDPLGEWIAFDVSVTAIGFVIASALVAASVKGIRILASFFTAGGGSAA